MFDETLKNTNELKTSGERTFSELLDSINDVFYITDESGKFVFVSGNSLKSIGINKENIIGKNFTEVFNKDTVQLHKNYHRRCLEGKGFLYDWEFTANGKTFFLQTSVSPTSLNGHKTNAVIGIIRDITKQKEIEKLHRELELTFRTLTNAATYSILSINEEKKIEYLNRATTKIFGYQKFELLGTGLDILLETQKAKNSKNQLTIEELFHIVKHEVQLTETFEFVGKKKDGTLFPIELTISSYEIFNVIHYVLIIQDITERKKTEENLKKSEQQLKIQNEELEVALSHLKRVQLQLVHSEKMASLGQLTAGIAHEINNPLAFVSSNLNRFKEYFEDINKLLDEWKSFSFSLTEKHQKNDFFKKLNKLEEEIDLEFVRSDFNNLMKHNIEGINRIKNIVQQLRGFSHFSENDMVEVNINEAVDETLTLVWNELKYKAEIIKDYDTLPFISCNVGEIKQVFINLLVNAAAAIEKKGEIKITTQNNGSFVSIIISDTGRGMSTETQAKIFDPFFTTKPVGQGTGLGLWICMTIIQKHNAKLNVESELGKGTSFIIELPVKNSKKN